jgi:2-keto-4-pentenoate hydratase/2-oxohepta-3-ene-1,7-dioic acid hydratase in catechol pathway
MKIVMFREAGIEKPGIMENGKIFDVQLMSDILSDLTHKEYPVVYSMVELIDSFEEIKKMVRASKKMFGEKYEALFSVKKTQLGAPISRESKIICLGKNYAEHAKETGANIPKEPILFGKFPDCAIADGEKIHYPKYATRIDPEIELAVVIGKACKNVKKKDAMQCVFGYTITNDVTERNLEYADMKAGHPWFRSKNFDSAMPIGPAIVTKDEIKNPHNLKIELSVNDKVRQKGSTKDMIFKIDYLIEYITQYLTLYPGDIISTGTVSGIAPVKKGDTIVCKIEKIGELKNKVV